MHWFALKPKSFALKPEHPNNVTDGLILGITVSVTSLEVVALGGGGT